MIENGYKLAFFQDQNEYIFRQFAHFRERLSLHLCLVLRFACRYLRITTAT